jgi:hypothetical protein
VVEVDEEVDEEEEDELEVEDELVVDVLGVELVLVIVTV